MRRHAVLTKSAMQPATHIRGQNSQSSSGAWSCIALLLTQAGGPEVIAPHIGNNFCENTDLTDARCPCMALKSRRRKGTLRKTMQIKLCLPVTATPGVFTATTTIRDQTRSRHNAQTTEAYLLQPGLEQSHRISHL